MERKKIGAGIIAIDKQTGDILLGRRSSDSTAPNTWAPFGGTFEISDHNPKNTAKREFSEETGSDAEYELSKSPFYIQNSPRLTFYTYIGIFENKFPVSITKEHLNYGWFPLESLPSNLLYGFKELLSSKESELKELIERIKNVQ
jgi:8-oxo-dGTP pyrophosphatase MutT (NUDIX family)